VDGLLRSKGIRFLEVAEVCLTRQPRWDRLHGYA
jgi:hypothetical protein